MFFRILLSNQNKVTNFCKKSFIYLSFPTLFQFEGYPNILKNFHRGIIKKYQKYRRWIYSLFFFFKKYVLKQKFWKIFVKKIELIFNKVMDIEKQKGYCLLIRNYSLFEQNISKKCLQWGWNRKKIFFQRNRKFSGLKVLNLT